MRANPNFLKVGFMLINTAAGMPLIPVATIIILFILLFLEMGRAWGMPVVKNNIFIII